MDLHGHKFTLPSAKPQADRIEPRGAEFRRARKQEDAGDQGKERTNYRNGAREKQRGRRRSGREEEGEEGRPWGEERRAKSGGRTNEEGESEVDAEEESCSLLRALAKASKGGKQQT